MVVATIKYAIAHFIVATVSKKIGASLKPRKVSRRLALVYFSAGLSTTLRYAIPV